MAKKKDFKLVATLTLHNAYSLTSRELAAFGYWLEQQRQFVQNHQYEISSRYTARHHRRSRQKREEVS